MKRLLLGLLLALLAVPALAQTNTTTTNGSVPITTGNTFQSVLSSVSTNATVRRSLTIQNNNTNGDNCWLFIGGTQITAGTTTKTTNITVGGNTITAGGASILLGQGGSYQRYYPYVPSDAIYATCATTSDTLYVDTQ